MSEQRIWGAQQGTLGQRVGVTDQYMRVWRLILFNQESAAGMLQTAIGSVFSATGTGEAMFTSEMPTGQDPGLMTHAAGLRIVFTVTQATVQTPNNAEITIYNLADRKADQLINESNYVILQAGYLYGQAGTIFSGSIKMFKRGHDNATDSYLKIYAADGDEAYCKAQVNRRFPAATTAPEKLQAYYQSLNEYNIGMGHVEDSIFRRTPGIMETPVVPIPRDDIAFGMTADHLRDFAQAYNANWYILDQRFYFTKPAYYDPGAIVVLTGRTGLIGFPEITQDGLNVTCLINPAIRLHQRLKLDNKSINQYFHSAGADPGLVASGMYNWLAYGQQVWYMPVQADGIYVPYSINYQGDSRGQPWYMYLICLAVDESKDDLSKIFGAMDWGFLT